ncbi:MAG: hypothetical protein FWC73_03110, partial [Defluviitaleaceae bacterium]|nr:hypothetical protein [Defluviitaleaceae bacterium]
KVGLVGFGIVSNYAQKLDWWVLESCPTMRKSWIGGFWNRVQLCAKVGLMGFGVCFVGFLLLVGGLLRCLGHRKRGYS